MRELDKILDSNEKIIWEGKPKFWPFFLGGVFAAFIFLVIILLVGVISSHPVGAGRIGIIFAVLLITYAYLSYKVIHYAITNKRVIIQKGIIGRDFDIADFDQITNAEVNVGFYDVLFGRGSGTISISTAGTFSTTKSGPQAHPYTMNNIDKPYEVFKLFKKVSHAVKTDISFPNKYRPKTNPGYNSRLNEK